MDEAQAGIKIAGRNISNLRYADDTTLMAESKEKLKSFLMRVKEESEKVGLTWVRSMGWEDHLEKGKLPNPVFWPGECHGLYNPWVG